MNLANSFSVEVHSRQDNWTNTPLNDKSNFSAVLHPCVNAIDKNVRFVSCDEDVQKFRRTQTNWTNFTSCSKYYEDQLDHDLLDDVDQTIHLLLTARRGKYFQEVGTCRIHVLHPMAIDVQSADPLGSEQGYSHLNCGEMNNVHLNPDFLKLNGDRANEEFFGNLESILSSLANTIQHQYTKRDGVNTVSKFMSNWHGKNQIYAGWNIQDNVDSGPTSIMLEEKLYQERVVPSSYVFARFSKAVEKLGAQTSSLQRVRFSVLPQNKTRKEDSGEFITAREPDKQFISKTVQHKTAELVIVQAIHAFMDIFEDALESPEIPLMQLDADSLVLNELADALSKACKKSVKVVDLFSSGRNTCAGLLRFLSGGTREDGIDDKQDVDM